MAARIFSNGGMYSEQNWLEALNELIGKAQVNDVFVEYLFPGGYLHATGFQLDVDERKLRKFLQQPAPSSPSNIYLELCLPAEEKARYRRVYGVSGDTYLSVTYPSCSHESLQDVSLAEIRISTSAALLSSAASESPVQ